MAKGRLNLILLDFSLREHALADQEIETLQRRSVSMIRDLQHSREILPQVSNVRPHRAVQVDRTVRIGPGTRRLAGIRNFTGERTVAWHFRSKCFAADNRR